MLRLGPMGRFVMDIYGNSSTFRELWRGRPMYIVLHQKILPNRRIRWAFVRTEGKLVVSMLKGLAMVLSQ